METKKQSAYFAHAKRRIPAVDFWHSRPQKYFAICNKTKKVVGIEHYYFKPENYTAYIDTRFEAKLRLWKYKQKRNIFP